MSDFLSNFSNDNYKNTMKSKKENEKPKESLKSEEPIDNESEENKGPKKIRKRKQRRNVEAKSASEVQTNDAQLFDSPDLVETEEQQSNALLLKEPTEDISDDLHEVSIDPEYKKKQRNKKIIIGISSVIAVIIVYIFYYQMTHVKMPDFADKSIIDVKKWANENRMELELKQAFSLKEEANIVMKQDINSGKNVKKGEIVKFTISEGPNPEEVIKLPDFKTLSQEEANQFVTKNKAENLNILTEYSDKIEKGKFTKVEFNDKEVTADTYKRRDTVNVYYSKGKETFEKNITVPDFTGKMKSEVQEWANKNGVAMTYEEADSDKVEEGKILSQNIEKNKKVAKHDKMTVKVSVGKAAVVPNFADYSAESAQGAVEGLEVSVKQVFADNIPYGQVISQSVEAGTRLTGKDSKSVKVVYSYGQPYIKSYFGQLEGDIPKLIYDDFNSKGANITYGIYYMDSEQEKGQIVKMSLYNQYIASNAYITFGISNGRYADLPGKQDLSTTKEGSEKTQTAEK
ncbi:MULTISPECIES: PASTA domain-containing protein [Vagococcus]|uniref:Serine/threonine protein kinase PrkC, regulator of stationary phase n=1 Tax=Vagococcus fluvialis bH819 TaxID=1255619 RepID=A0A1X6WN43_9ENTE|nr:MULTISPECIES: PASTA domain-containing protein [Vagococcus]SLM85744.1 Serine/threonine protein kinase PrkC, regulator of stationary phase [Vagococcus fluvialis bH819]HCM90166.1 PASTA domain-containing protein [Vagococcus sp.]